MTTEPPGAATPLRNSGVGRSGWPTRTAWGTLALLLAAFAVFESQKYGTSTTAAALVSFVLPDLARLVGIRRPGVLYQAVNSGWIPLVVLVGYTVGPIVWPPLFTAGLGWLTRIAFDRTRGLELT
ncbi:DUF4260 domain-containing protein [Streptomyces sp. NPDC096339]|uniref:DUF4260 domain-containing protein n=1 Tax=Streptomyces sp. NPDC096339 TaxID=3366086 RepID=UPI0037FACE7E